MFTFIVIAILVGVGLYLMNAYIPMDARIKNIVTILAIVLLVIWALKLIFFMAASPTVWP